MPHIFFRGESGVGSRESGRKTFPLVYSTPYSLLPIPYSLLPGLSPRLPTPTPIQQMDQHHGLGARIGAMVAEKAIIAGRVPEAAVRALPLEKSRVATFA